MNMIIVFKILPFKDLMHLLLVKEDLPSMEKKDFFIFLGKESPDVVFSY